MSPEHLKRKYSPENFDIAAALDKMGPYGIPTIEPVVINKPIEFVPFNDVVSKDIKGKGVHFFLYDFQFKRVWEQPCRYTEMLKKAVLF